MTGIPQAAIDAAAIAMHDTDCGDTHCEPTAMGGYHASAQRALEAAAPHIAAAERQRIYAELGNDHFVIFTEDRWTVEHSVECRLSGHMPECEYHAAIAAIAAEFEPGMAGRWLITGIDLNGEPALVRDDLLDPAEPVAGDVPPGGPGTIHADDQQP